MLSFVLKRNNNYYQKKVCNTSAMAIYKRNAGRSCDDQNQSMRDLCGCPRRRLRMKGAVAMARRVRPSRGRQKIQPTAITVRDRLPDRLRFIRHTPSVTMSRTNGSQSTEVVQQNMNLYVMKVKNTNSLNKVYLFTYLFKFL